MREKIVTKFGATSVREGTRSLTNFYNENAKTEFHMLLCIIGGLSQRNLA